MPRPIRQVVFAFPGTTLAEAKANLQPDINRLLTAARLGNVEVDRVLLALSERQPFTFHGWPKWAALALVNLRSNIRSGDYHLLCCQHCANWMLVKNSGRRICPTCRRALAATRQATRRRVEYEAQKRARPRCTKP